MAKITNLTILNPADKTRMFSIATGSGAVAEASDPIVTNVKDFPVGSQYMDVTNKKLYVRFTATPAVADWVAINSD